MSIPESGPDPLASAPVPSLPRVHVRGDAAWEYTLLARDLDRQGAPSEDELNGLGAEGWEMCGVLSNPPLVYLCFKRPRG